MRAIVYSCKYHAIIPYFCKLWNKYYSDKIEVIIVSPEDISKYDLPSNFSHYKLSNFTKSWVNDISEFFKDFKDEYFFSCMEDHFLYDYVQTDIINAATR